MALHQYGVCIGTFNRFDNDGQQGHWLHGLVFLDLPGEERPWRCAVDVKGLTAPVQYVLVEDISVTDFANIASLPDGYHDLAKTPASGAVDYVRGKVIVPRGKWITATGPEADDALRALVSDTQRIFVFGEPFHNVDGENGMHNVHMNQGDPPGQFRSDDGIWQDGATIILTSDGKLRAFMNKFTTQSLKTDENGLPLLEERV
jgi:hypothetical protein